MPIWLQVNAHSGVPLYVQLVEQIQRAVQVGILRPGDSLPPMRQLAAELHLALNTIVKAYSELETLGIIETRGGAGTIISAAVSSVLRPQAVEQVRQRLHVLTGDAAALQVSEQELRDWLDAEIRQIYPTTTVDVWLIGTTPTERKREDVSHDHRPSAVTSHQSRRACHSDGSSGGPLRPPDSRG